MQGEKLEVMIVVMAGSAESDAPRVGPELVKEELEVR